MTGKRVTREDSNSMSVLTEVRRRRVPNPYVDDEVVEFLVWCADKIVADRRTPSVVTMKDYMSLYGPPLFGGFHPFISVCWQQVGSKADIEAFLKKRGYYVKPEGKEGAGRKESPKREFKRPVIQI